MTGLLKAPHPPRPVTHRPRLFFLGAHKVLLRTELPRLRQLGYEVFNPPYLSNVHDQSAITDWDFAQDSTLPSWAFDKLRRYNFFYNPIDPDIADILNTYFDGAVVTILARWAVELARAFKGIIVFRTYGQTSSLSEDFDRIRGRSVIEAHGRFHFLPHAAETLDSEQRWLVEKTVVVPYCLPDDIFAHADSWQAAPIRSGEILVTAPNIRGNVFHSAHYQFLKEYFYHSHFKMMGVQLNLVDDEQVIGTVSRERQLELFKRANGYFYSYSDPRVCYLPPIEMMVLGGPVIYLRGSLLGAYVGRGGPGEASTIGEAHRLCTRLLVGDAAFADDVRASQTSTRNRYTPQHVWPIFDRELNTIFGALEVRPPAQDLLPAESVPYRSSSGSERLSRFLLTLLEGTKNASDEALRTMAGAIQEVLPPTSGFPAEAATVGKSLHRSIRDVLPVTAAAYARTETLLQGLTRATRDILRNRSPGAPSTETLVDAMRREGSVAAFRVVRAAGYTGDDVALALFGTTGTTIDRQLVGKRNLLLDGCILLSGRWEIDETSGLVRCCREPGDAGFVVYGPYISLEPGSYRATFEIWSQTSVACSVGAVDCVSNGALIASSPIVAGSGASQRITLAFTSGHALERCEFRVWTNGMTHICITSIYLEQ